MSFQWITPPETLAKNIEDYGRQVLIAVQAAATYWGQQCQNDARQNAPWEDRTAAARGGLFFAVDGFGLEPITGTVTPEAQQRKKDVEIVSGDEQTLIITLGHTVYYGKYLELCNGGRYAVVMSTLESRLPDLERMLKGILQ
jgi:hypothetical protein